MRQWTVFGLIWAGECLQSRIEVVRGSGEVSGPIRSGDEHAMVQGDLDLLVMDGMERPIGLGPNPDIMRRRQHHRGVRR